MAYSEVDICNHALGLLGADAIRSFDENNKRARQCKKFYDATRDYLYALFDWPFARGFKNLNELDLSAEDVPEGEQGFQLPHDCMVPRDIHPRGNPVAWTISKDRLFTKVSTVGLYYTTREEDTSLFSSPFMHILSLGIAVKLCPPITQDKELTKSLYAQFKQDLRDCQEADANIGNDYRMFDEDPDNDSFVTGEKVSASVVLSDDGPRAG